MGRTRRACSYKHPWQIMQGHGLDIPMQASVSHTMSGWQGQVVDWDSEASLLMSVDCSRTKTT